MNLQFRPKFTGRYGNAIAILQGKQADAGITASATTLIGIVSPYQRYAILTASFQMTTPLAGGAPITVWIQKHSGSGGDVIFSAGTEMRGLNANQSYLIPLSIPNVNTPKFVGTEQFVVGESFQPNQTFIGNNGYFVEAVITAAGTVTTQPVGLIITLEVAVVG